MPGQPGHNFLGRGSGHEYLITAHRHPQADERTQRLRQLLFFGSTPSAKRLKDAYALEFWLKASNPGSTDYQGAAVQRSGAISATLARH